MRDMYNFQLRVNRWVDKIFGHEIAMDVQERRFRFLEEALELFQASNGSKEEAREMLEYVFARPKGHLPQEVGGTIITLAALCTATGVTLDTASFAELYRCESNIEKIKAKALLKTLVGFSISNHQDNKDQHAPPES